MPRRRSQLRCGIRLYGFRRMRTSDLNFQTSVYIQPRSRRLAPAHLIDGISSVCSKRRDQDRAPESVARSRSEARGFTRLVYIKDGSSI
jgi:hypothetical protein